MVTISMQPGYVIDRVLRIAADRWPDNVALTADGRSLTYADLDQAADQVAATLIGQGVRTGDRVGLHLEKSSEAVSSLYGIMRAGAAYVPIDPSSPPERASYLATDCDIAALISDPVRVTALRELDPGSARRGIAVGAPVPDGFVGWDDIGTAPAASSRPVVDTDLAYVLYTSGSTGRPKGVAISHRNSLTFVTWARRTFGLDQRDVLANHAPLNFDLSTLDLFAAASAGARVALVPASASMFPVRLVDWIEDQRITVWYSVPSALSMLVRYGNLASRQLGELRLVLFAGEVFPVRYLRQLMQQIPQARFFNLYGPTETNVCTYYEVTDPPSPDDPPVPIGTACENTRCAVVSDSGVVTEVGAEGELVVTGSTVAQGYWNDPERTRQGFPEPYTYRTGDFVKILDASMNPCYGFIGRRDHLVKTRGYRVELGEIEATLYAHGSVSECVVTAVPDELLGSRLAAFCAVTAGTLESELKRTCRARLPPYMVPERVILMDALPRNPNDKLDRAELARRAAALIGPERGE